MMFRIPHPQPFSRWERVAFAFLIGAFVLGCENGYQGGPFERGARAVLNGFDMWATESVRPYEDPMPPHPEGAVPTEDFHSMEKGRADYKKMSKEDRSKKSALSYRRYCYHCHGPNGDGRVIAGESHEFKPADLRSAHTQALTDEEIFTHVQEGGQLMLPLAATLSPVEIMLVIDHIRTLKDHPSTPHFKPQFTEPIR